MKEFLVATERADEEEDHREPIPFKLVNPDKSEREMLAHFPGEGQLAAFMATNASFASTPERVAGILNFFVSVLEEEEHSYIVNRLYDRKDNFGPRDIIKVIEGLMEDWTGRPTEPPAVSTRSRQSGGRKSTHPTPALT